MSKRNMFLKSGSTQEAQVKKYLDKLDKNKRKCPGHWINKGMKIKNKDCYDRAGRCAICGGYKKEFNILLTNKQGNHD